MSVTLTLMAASAAYGAYQNYQASEAEQESLLDQAAFHREYLEEIDRRQSVNETLALKDISSTQAQLGVSAAALGQSTSGVSTLVAMEEVARLGSEQIIRDRQEYEWERQSQQYSQDAMIGQVESSQSSQRTQLFSDILGGTIQASRYTNSSVKG